MPYKMIGRIRIQRSNIPEEDYLRYHRAQINALFKARESIMDMVKEEGADRYYLGRPNRQIGQIVQTKHEIKYDYVKYIPRWLQHLWRRVFPDQQDIFQENGVYIRL